MFNIGNILKRAWQILWSYKLLWLFALLIALTGGAGNSGGGGGGGSSYRSATQSDQGFMDKSNFPQWEEQFEQWAEQNLAPLFATEQRTIQTILWFVAAVILISLLIGLVLCLVRYPAETAVIRMVDEHEQSGVKYRFKEAWKLGWNQRAWRMFLIDLIIGTPAFAIIMSLVGLIVWLGILVSRDVLGQQVAGLVVAIILFGLFMLLFGIFMWFVSLLRQYVVRFATLENSGVWESFRRGWKMFKANFKNTFLMGLVLIGVGIGLGFVMIFAVFLLIPVYAVLALPGALAAAIPGAIGYGITSLFSSGIWPWIVGGILAVPLLFMVIFSPISFLSGMIAVFTSNVWTLTFRQLKTDSTPPPLEVAELHEQA